MKKNMKKKTSRDVAFLSDEALAGVAGGVAAGSVQAMPSAPLPNGPAQPGMSGLVNPTASANHNSTTAGGLPQRGQR